MCGINGFNFEDKNLMKDMNERIKHRGPDGNGLYVDKISLGHQRLAIIDLSERGKQPMSNEDGDILIVFNGEIYNFNELKEELKKNHKFRSKSDTEVIIHAYEEWGEKCVKKFNGMWAFCIYDKRKNIFFLSRDRFGKKPLYYYNDHNKFIFSSEIKAILLHNIKRELNKKAVSSYLSYRSVLGETTFFKDILKLLPAHNLVYDLKLKKIIKEYEYWDIVSKEKELSEEIAKEFVKKDLERSVISRKVSDVPLGVILSGGLDSSLITAFLALNEKNKINTFTVNFIEKGFDETRFAKMVAEKYKTNYFEIVLNVSNFIDVMKEYIKYKDEPIGVPNEIALYLLSKKIKQYVTVVLSGEGADELFEGYGKIFTSYRDYEILNKLKNMPQGESLFKTKFSSLFKKYGKFFESDIEHFLYLYHYWREDEKEFILLPESKEDYKPIFKKAFEKINGDYRKKISYVFLKLHLPGLLNRLDNPTMANAIEARTPFLDYIFAENIFNLPLEYKTKWKIKKEDIETVNKTCDELSEVDNIPKYILKKVAEDYLPYEIINRKKQGFPLPLNEWFKGKLEQIAKNILLNKNAKIGKVINKKNLAEWINLNRQDSMFGQKLWMLLSLELWLKEWFPDI